MQNDNNSQVNPMEPSVTRVETEVIMKEICKEIEEKGYQSEELHFREVDISPDIAGQDCYNPEVFEKAVYDINHLYKLSFEYDRHPNKIRQLVQKLVERLIRFYVNPIAEAQQQYNIETTHAMNEIRLFHLQTETDLEELNISSRSATYDMTKTIRDMQKEIQQLKSDLNRANQRLQAAEEELKANRRDSLDNKEHSGQEEV